MKTLLALCWGAFSGCCCCFSHSAYWLPTRKKPTLHGGQSRSWSAEQEKKKVWQRSPPPPPRCSFGENKYKNHATHPHVVQVLRKSAVRRSRSVSHPYKDSYDSSARPMGVASQNSTMLPCAIATFPVSLPLSSPGDVWPRLPLLPSTRPWTSVHPPLPPQPRPQSLTPSLASPPLCQTPGCRERYRYTQMRDMMNLEYGRADARRNGRACFARPNPQRRSGTGNKIVSLFSWPRVGSKSIPIDF